MRQTIYKTLYKIGVSSKVRNKVKKGVQEVVAPYPSIACNAFAM